MRLRVRKNDLIISCILACACVLAQWFLPVTHQYKIHDERMTYPDDVPRHLIKAVPQELQTPGSYPMVVQRSWVWNGTWVRLTWDQAPKGPSDIWDVQQTRSGMPFTMRVVVSGTAWQLLFDHIYGTRSNLTDAQRAELSIRPQTTIKPLGIVLNFVLFTAVLYYTLPKVIHAIWWVITFRRRRRVRLGLCLNCAYAIGEASQCPECSYDRDGYPGVNVIRERLAAKRRPGFGLPLLVGITIVAGLGFAVWTSQGDQLIHYPRKEISVREPDNPVLQKVAANPTQSGGTAGRAK